MNEEEEEDRHDDHDNNDEDTTTTTTTTIMNRRNFLTSSTTAAAAALFGTTTMATTAEPALAGGLMQFPCLRPLKNRYHFMRAGPSELEVEGLWATNPLFLTNRENALATSSMTVVEEACQAIQASGHLPTVAYHSLAANGIDTADYLGQQLRLGRDRILPEFTYLDPRGIGLWDSNDVSAMQPAVWAMDALEAGPEGTGGRPPPKDDGTPNETLADQFVRLRQFLSLQESRTSGENILLIFPDGTGPALLSAMIAGIPLNHVHALDYRPGEVRLDITRESILELYRAKKNDPVYLSALEDGKEKLDGLRKQTTMVSLKDQRAEQERLELDRVFLRSKEQQREKDLAREQKAKQQRQEQQRESSQSQSASSSSIAGATAATTTSNASATAPIDNVDLSSVDTSSVLATLAMGAAGVGLAVAGGFIGSGGGGDDKIKAESGSGLHQDGPAGMVAETNINSGSVGMEMPAAITPTASLNTGEVDQVINQDSKDQPRRDSPVNANNDDNDTTVTSSSSGGGSSVSSSVDDELKRLEAAQEAMDTFLMQESKTAAADPIRQELDQLYAAQKAMDEYLNMDDGANDWLQVLAEIRDEPDHDDDDDDVVEYVNGEKL